VVPKIFTLFQLMASEAISIVSHKLPSEIWSSSQ